MAISSLDKKKVSDLKMSLKPIFFSAHVLYFWFYFGFSLASRSFISNYSSIVDSLYSVGGLIGVPNNPVGNLVKKLESFFGNYNICDLTDESWQDCCQSEYVSDLTEEAKKLNVREEATGLTLEYSKFSFATRVVEKLQKNCHSFILSGTEIDFFLPPSSRTHPVSHKLVAVQTFTELITPLKLQSVVNSVLEAFVEDICSCIKDLRRENSCQGVSQTNPLSTSSSVESETTQLKNGVQTRFLDVRCTGAASIGCHCRNQDGRKKCIFCRMEKHYLGHDISPQVCINDLIQPSPKTTLYHKDMLLVSCGILDISKFPKVCCGWLMEVNIDSLALALCNIPDIRLLWSNDPRIQEQFSSQEVRVVINSCNKLFNLISVQKFSVIF